MQSFYHMIFMIYFYDCRFYPRFVAVDRQTVVTRDVYIRIGTMLAMCYDVLNVPQSGMCTPFVQH